MTRAAEGAAAIHPGFAAYQQVIPLAGFSGAAIALLRNPGGSPFVRKAAMSPETNGTLRAQAVRQLWLRGEIGDAAGVPAILGEDEVEGLYYFDMEFVPSRDANSFLATASFADVERFAGSIETLVQRLSHRRLPDAAAPTNAPLLDKVAEIDGRTDGAFADLLEPLRIMIANSSAIDQTSATVCHGDLTFENILVGAGQKLWLIDPIPSPIDHFFLDWTKLFQECEGHWYRHRNKPLSAGVVHWLRNRWHRTACAMAPGYERWHYLLLALTFARILPYARNPRDVDFVSSRVRAFSLSARRLLEA